MGNEDLIRQFRDALVDENVDAFEDCVNQVDEAIKCGSLVGPALADLLKQLNLMAHLNESALRELMACPEAREAWDRFAARMDSLLGE